MNVARAIKDGRESTQARILQLAGGPGGMDQEDIALARWVLWIFSEGFWDSLECLAVDQAGSDGSLP